MGDVLHLPAAPVTAVVVAVDVDEVCGQLETYAAWRIRFDEAEAAARMGIDTATADRLETTITILGALGGTA